MNDISLVFIELGIAIISLALLTYLSGRWGFSAIPLYLLVGLAFGNGGILPLQFSEQFVHIGAEIGVLLLLFMLGLEYTGESCRPASAPACQPPWEPRPNLSPPPSADRQSMIADSLWS